MPPAAAAVTVAVAGPPPVRPGEDFVFQREANSGYEGHLTDKQQAALDSMRAKNYSCVESVAGEFVIDDACLLRFLRARKFDVAKADAMLTQHLAWRDKLLPTRIKPEEVTYQLLSGLTTFGPYTKSGMPTILIRVEEFEPHRIDSMEVFSKFCAFFFNRVISKLPPGVDKIVLIFDLKAFSLRKHATPFGMKCIAELVSSVQANNPERLAQILILHSPMLFSGVWKVISPMLDPVVASKIHFLSKYNVLLDQIDADALPKQMGGNRELPYPCECVDELTKEAAE